jgi:hypothetical protein
MRIVNMLLCPVLGGDEPSPGFSDFGVDTVRDYCPTEGLIYTPKPVAQDKSYMS